MPCLNEERTLPGCISVIQRFFSENNVDGEIIVADNGSTDGSITISQSLGAHIVPVSQRGYGSALAKGIQEAKNEFVIMGDSDGSYNFAEMGPIIEKLQEGNDFVIGNRFKGGIRAGAMPFLHKYLGNPVLSLIGRVFFQTGVRDIYCGLRGFRKQSALQLHLRSSGMEFAIEMIVKASQRKMRLCEVPVTLSPDGRDRPPHLRTWPDGWRSLRFLLLYSPRWLFLYPGITLMFLSALISARLMVGPILVNGIGFDVQTLLFMSMFFSIGYQMVLFGMACKVVAISRNLIPAAPRVVAFFKTATLERGVLVGILLSLIGIISAGIAFYMWQVRAFGALDLQNSLRIVIPSALAICLGLQTIFSSFLISALSVEAQSLDSQKS